MFSEVAQITTGLVEAAENADISSQLSCYGISKFNLEACHLFRNLVIVFRILKFLYLRNKFYLGYYAITNRIAT